MPFILILVALVIMVSAYRGTQDALFKLVQGDFTGSDAFAWWVLAIIAIGAVGYVPALEKFSRAMLGLVLLVLFISNGGFFAKFTQQLGSQTKAEVPGPKDATLINFSGGSGGSGSGSGSSSDSTGSTLSTVAEVAAIALL